jgi:hypothetical protein
MSFQAVILSIIAFLASAAFASPLFFFTKLEVVFLDAAYCYEVCWLQRGFYIAVIHYFSLGHLHTPA